jgi:hypothetical protein
MVWVTNSLWNKAASSADINGYVKMAAASQESLTMMVTEETFVLCTGVSQKTPWLLDRKWTILTKWRPLVSKI